MTTKLSSLEKMREGYPGKFVSPGEAFKSIRRGDGIFHRNGRAANPNTWSAPLSIS